VRELKLHFTDDSSLSSGAADGGSWNGGLSGSGRSSRRSETSGSTNHSSPSPLVVSSTTTIVVEDFQHPATVSTFFRNTNTAEDDSTDLATVPEECKVEVAFQEGSTTATTSSEEDVEEVDSKDMTVLENIAAGLAQL